MRAADALQLASALIWAQETPRGLSFVCLGQNLREGAFKEGSSVLPPISNGHAPEDLLVILPL